jgi:hypothetical protein
VKTKHSPAPWRYRPFKTDDWGTIRDAQGYIVAMVNGRRYDGDCYEEKDLAKFRQTKRDPYEANALLVSAGMEMLNVLKELYESSRYWSDYDVPLGIADRIKEAILKAEPNWRPKT